MYDKLKSLSYGVLGRGKSLTKKAVKKSIDFGTKQIQLGVNYGVSNARAKAGLPLTESQFRYRFTTWLFSQPSFRKLSKDDKKKALQAVGSRKFKEIYGNYTASGQSFDVWTKSMNMA